MPSKKGEPCMGASSFGIVSARPSGNVQSSCCGLGPRRSMGRYFVNHALSPAALKIVKNGRGKAEAASRD
jgi:hypothetical protein